MPGTIADVSTLEAEEVSEIYENLSNLAGGYDGSGENGNADSIGSGGPESSGGDPDQATETLDPVDPIAIAVRNASCRKGTDASFDILNFLYEGQSAQIIGRSNDSLWFYLDLPDNLGRCWVYHENLHHSVAVPSLLIYESPILVPENQDGSSQEGEEDNAQDFPTNEGPESCNPETEYWSSALQSCQPFG